MGNESGSSRIGPDDEGIRLDIKIATLTGISRNRAQWLISNGHVYVNGKPAKKNHMLSPSEVLTWDIPYQEFEDIRPQEIPLDVVYEDSSVIVIDKPAGIVMYPGPGHPEDTLLNAILSLYPDVKGVGGRGRFGIFHRLDRDTSGLVAVARTVQAFNTMVEQMKNREVVRRYLALIAGAIPAQDGVIDAPMGRSRGNRKRMAVRLVDGRPAVSRFTVKERFEQGYTLVEVTLETGRTHQIRVHFSHIGYPVAGDPEYSRGRAHRELGLDRQFLHACMLSFEHPVSKKLLEFKSELPHDLEQILQHLRSRR